METSKITSIDIYTTLNNVKDYIHELEEKIRELNINRDMLLKNIQDIDIIKKQNYEYSQEIEKYKSTIENMKKDTSSFSKISHIVSLENENHKLKQDIELLNLRIKKLVNSSNNNTDRTLIDEKIENNNMPIQCDEQHNCENVEDMNNLQAMSHSGEISTQKTIDICVDTNYTKKKINGTFYYILDINEDDSIELKSQPFYNINEDNSIGSHVGNINIRDDGKKKIQWLS